MRLPDVLARRDPVWWCNRSNKHAKGDEQPDGVYCTVRLDIDPEGIRYHLASKWECHWVVIIPLDEFEEWEEVVDSVEVTE